MTALYTNNATPTLASSITNVATSLTVATGQGSIFPTITGSNYFMCTLQSTSGSPLEIVKVTARSTDTFTIVRAQEGTTGSAFNSGDFVELRLTAGEITNFPQLDAPNTFTGLQTFNGTSSNEALKVLNIAEPANVVGTAPTATTNFYINSGAVQYYTANNANNWTLNFAFSSGTSLNTAMSVNDSVSCTMIVTNTTTAYYPSAFTIDGTSVTPKWQGGSAPTSGDVSAIDVYNFVITKTASATYTVLASVTKFA